MLCDKSIDQNTYDYLHVYPNEHKIRIPHCYFLPKIHKITPADRVSVGRNIVSNCGGPCEKIGEFIDFFLVPLVQNQYTYLRDTKDVIRKIEQLKIPKHCLLVTIILTVLGCSLMFYKRRSNKMFLRPYQKQTRKYTFLKCHLSDIWKHYY